MTDVTYIKFCAKCGSPFENHIIGGRMSNCGMICEGCEDNV